MLKTDRTSFSVAFMAIITLLCISALFLLHSVKLILLFSMVVFLPILMLRRRLVLIWTSIKLTLPFLLPLLLVHGVINPGFSKSIEFASSLPIRFGGVEFAILISARIFLFTMCAASWMVLDMRSAMAEVSRWSVGQGLVVVIAVAVTTMRGVKKRASRILLAQQARGIATGPGLLRRIKAMPAIILPVITATIVEGHGRGEIMKSRGLGLHPLYSDELRGLSIGEVAYSVSVGILLIIATLSKHHV